MSMDRSWLVKWYIGSLTYPAVAETEHWDVSKMVSCEMESYVDREFAITEEMDAHVVIFFKFSKVYTYRLLLVFIAKTQKYDIKYKMIMTLCNFLC